MLLKILKMILYFFVIFAKPVYADNFDSTIDTSSNQYFQTIAFAVSDYPSIKNILYQKSDFLAESTSSILSNNIEAFTDFDNTRRIPMTADHVDAPPGTQVDIVYLYRNSTGHEVNMSKVDLALSRNIKENGSLVDILDVQGYTEGNLTYKYSGQNLIKSGIYKEYAGKGIIANGGNGAYILESVKVKNPLSIDDMKATKNEKGGVDFNVYVQNNSNESLNSLKFTYGTYEESFNLEAEQEHVVSFSIQEIPSELGSFKIYNPNVKQICSIYGSPYYTYNQTDAISVFSYRGAHIIPGAVVQPVRDSFCIKRIPYTMISEPMILSEVAVEPQEVIPEVESVVEVEEEPEVDIPDVLGTFDMILPKAGKGAWGLITLLVVDVLLWYSVYILRRNYESKDTNSRVCAKSK